MGKQEGGGEAVDKGLREGEKKEKGRWEERDEVSFWNVAGLRNKFRGFWKELGEWDVAM